MTSFTRSFLSQALHTLWAIGLILLPAEVAVADSRPVPDGARVSLLFAGSQSFVLGDVIELSFLLSNAGVDTFTFQTGGDYRGTGFPTRYKFTVVDDHGTALRGESWVGFGGLADWKELKSGGEFREALRLQNYVRLNRPGVYTVRVVHDFGWAGTKDKPLPVAEATITVTLPSAEQARQRVKAVAAAEAPPKESELGRIWARTEFRLLTNPVFLHALEEAAQAGQVNALEGIGRIESPETMPALMRLIDSENLDVVHAAALFASRRIPARVVDGHPRLCGWYGFPEQAAAYAPFWTPDAVGPLRRAAGRLLRSTKTEQVKTGANIIEFIGQADDGAIVLEALGVLMKEWKVRSGPEDNILDSPGAGNALIEALRGLRERGYRAPDGGGVNVILAVFLELADSKMPRRTGWEQTLEAFFDQNPPMLREAAVRALPKPVTGNWEKLLAKALNDEDRGVMRAACEVAGNSENPSFAVALANIVRTEQQQFLVFAAADALTKLGQHWAATDAWIERLTDERLCFDGLSFLLNKLEHPKGSGLSGQRGSREARVAMRSKWQLFFSDPARRALVQSGKPIPVTEEQAWDLFSGMIQVPLGDGKNWPSKNP